MEAARLILSVDKGGPFSSSGSPANRDNQRPLNPRDPTCWMRHLMSEWAEPLSELAGSTSCYSPTITGGRDAR